MSDTLPTIEVKNPLTGGMMIINESDYDPAMHELWEVAVATPDDEGTDTDAPVGDGLPNLETEDDAPYISEVVEQSKRQRRRGRSENSEANESTPSPEK